MATTHLKAKLEALRSSFRTEQSRDILGWLDTVRGGRPVILTGDFNGLPSEQFYANLTQSTTVPLVSSYKVTGEGKIDYTTWKIRQSGEQKHVLDYILHTPVPRKISTVCHKFLGKSDYGLQTCAKCLSLVGDDSLKFDEVSVTLK